MLTKKDIIYNLQAFHSDSDSKSSVQWSMLLSRARDRLLRQEIEIQGIVSAVNDKYVRLHFYDELNNYYQVHLYFDKYALYYDYEEIDIGTQFRIKGKISQVNEREISVDVNAVQSVRKESPLKRQSVEVSFGDALIQGIFYGFGGLGLGVLIGFGKGCKSYAHHNGGLSEPFKYIPQTALIFCVIGGIIGILIGFMRGSK